MFVRSGFPFNYDTDMVSEETGLDCKDVTRCIQSAAEECDINTIVRRFHLTGELPQGVVAPQFGDFTGIFDYQSARNMIRRADEAFMEMPADIRARFHHDGQEFVEFCSKEENRVEAEKLGLVLPKVEEVPPPPLRVEVVPPKVVVPS